MTAIAMVGLSAVRAEHVLFKKRLEVSEGMSKDAQANEMEKLVQKYISLNEQLIDQNKALRHGIKPTPGLD